MEPASKPPTALFPLLITVLPHGASIAFSIRSLSWVRCRDPALDSCLNFRCLRVEGGPELQVTWAEVIEVPVVSKPTCFTVLGNLLPPKD